MDGVEEGRPIRMVRHGENMPSGAFQRHPRPRLQCCDRLRPHRIMAHPIGMQRRHHHVQGLAVLSQAPRDAGQ
jgi:hypothetical protein